MKVTLFVFKTTSGDSRKFALSLLFLFAIPVAYAQDVPSKDVIDLIRCVFKPHGPARSNTNARSLHLSAIPAAGYTLQTGFAVLASGNATFYLGKDSTTKQSTALTSVAYTANKQFLFPFQTSLYTNRNDYNIITDWRYYKYPEETYGLGGRSQLSKVDSINYSYAKFYTTFLRKLVPNLYAGLGFDVDAYYDITEINKMKNNKSDFQKYGASPVERVYGITLNGLFDNRINPINPRNGVYANIIFRGNPRFLGNSSRWTSVILDFRKYIHFNGSSDVLAFWSYDWITGRGKPPYFSLPYTGGDNFNNTGRGYVQGRYRGRDMIYLESEFRFKILRNGLLGGVAFANTQTFAKSIRTEFNVFNPGYGGGIRIKLNKFSDTNIAIDYGFGTQGSRGFLINLGEVF